jgi:DNA modification methylase
MLGRDYTGFEMNPDYCELIQDRLAAARMQSDAAEPESEQDNEPA